MRLNGRRESTNVDDRRGRSAAKIGGVGGIGGIIVIALVTLLSGGNLGDVFNSIMSNPKPSPTVPASNA